MQTNRLNGLIDRIRPNGKSRLNSLMLSAHAHGLATCAQGALATWASPIRSEFKIPAKYQLICGVSIGYASASAVNNFNPGRSEASMLQIESQK